MFSEDIFIPADYTFSTSETIHLLFSGLHKCNCLTLILTLTRLPVRNVLNVTWRRRMTPMLWRNLSCMMGPTGNTDNKQTSNRCEQKQQTAALSELSQSPASFSRAKSCTEWAVSIICFIQSSKELHWVSCLNHLLHSVKLLNCS